MLFLLSGLALANDPAPPPIINGGDATEDDYGMAGAMLMDATITISDKDVDQDNSDIYRGWFSSGQFENQRDGGRSNDIRGIDYFGPGSDR